MRVPLMFETAPSSFVATPCESSGWRARLSLEFETRNQRTLLTRRRHEGPLLVQRPFYPEGPICHVYLLHPPGGVAGGDVLELEVDLKSASEALITTPAAAKFYRSRGPFALQTTRIRVANHASLEWLPQENILFDRARLKSLTRFELDEHSRLLGWEISCAGRPACNESFDSGVASMGLEIWLCGKPLLIEKLNLTGDTLRLNCGLRGRSCVATLYVYPATNDLVARVREVAASKPDFGATLIENLLICRMLADQAEAVRDLFVSIWKDLRFPWNQKVACIPRIWST